MTCTWATGPNEADLEFYGAYRIEPYASGSNPPIAPPGLNSTCQTLSSGARWLPSRADTDWCGEVDQIAAAHLYLMDNHFVTGTVLTVDGGAVLL